VTAEPAQPRPSLAAVFRAFLTVGLTSFGGGRTAYFQEAIIARRKWLSDGEFLEAVAVSQVLPGPNIGNLAAFLGQRLRGWRGAVIAVACLTVPGALAILGLAWLYFHGMPASVTGPVGKGVSAAAVGLAAASVLRLRGGVAHISGYGIAAVTFVLFGPLGWPILLVLAVCVPPSFALAWSRRR
jgi:chromate transporter